MKNNTFYAVKLYFGNNSRPTVIQYYAKKGNAIKRAKNAVLSVYDRSVVALTNAVYLLEDESEVNLVSYRKDKEKHAIIEYNYYSGNEIEI